MRHSGSGSGSTPGATATNQESEIAVLNAILAALGGGGVLGKAGIALSRNEYAGSPVTTSAYTELISSMPADVSEIYIFDSSGQTLVLALGAIGVEIDTSYVIPGGNGIIPLRVPSGERVSIKAVSANATVGEFSATFFG